MDDWDWELLHDSSQVNEESGAKVEELKRSASSTASSVCDDCGVIRSDYFSLDSHHHDQLNDEDEDESSDNPSWIDPSNNMSVAGRRVRTSSSSNSVSSDPSDSRNLLLLIEPHSDCAETKWADSSELGNEIPADEAPLSGEFHDAIADVSVNKMTQEDKGYEGDHSDLRESNLNSGGKNAGVVEEEEGEGERGLLSESNEEKKVVWWRVPLEVLKYCVLRVSPVWSLSMAAAAVMGLVILRRRYLYRMKRKTQGLQLKVTVDDKKVSQFMSRVGRLNEAFSVVKRVPIIRPSLPAPGLTPWPVVSLR